VKAIYFEEHGGPEVLRFGELPEPVAGPGELIVDVVAASINAADWKVRRGFVPIERFPHVLGRDFSGTVAALGDGVREFKVGDRVFGVCDRGQEGAYAEKLVMRASLVARLPDSIPHAHAAAHALAGLTALVALEDTMHLRAGETLLIQGGAGGVAGFAIQLAKHIGARVITTASAANHDYLRSLGADEIIDYNAVDFTKVVRDCDGVFDTVGGEVSPRSFLVVKPGGRVASIFGMEPPPSPRADVRSLKPDVQRDRPHLERIVALVQAGVIRPPEITEFPLSEAAEAHRVSEARHLRGKLILMVR